MVMVHKGKANWEAAVYDCIGLAGGKPGGQEGESLCTRTRIWAAHKIFLSGCKLHPVIKKLFSQGF